MGKRAGNKIFIDNLYVKQQQGIFLLIIIQKSRF